MIKSILERQAVSACRSVSRNRTKAVRGFSHTTAKCDASEKVDASDLAASLLHGRPQNESSGSEAGTADIIESSEAPQGNNAEAGPSRIGGRAQEMDKMYGDMFGVNNASPEGVDMGAKPRSFGLGSKDRSAPRNSIQDILYPPDWTASARPNRILKGVHRRVDRAKGATPHEVAAFNDVLSSIIADLDRNAATNGTNGPFTALSTPDMKAAPWGFKFPGFGRKTIKERKIQPEEDAKLSEELYALKEEMCMFQTDVELLEWTKSKVFAPIPADEESPTTGITFPRVYPRILAHVIKTLRADFNNPQLALAVFHHAQTHSLESYLMGCLAPAYNELIQIRWDFFRDLQGVESAVREMQLAGVGWDKETRSIVGRVVQSVSDSLLQSRHAGTGTNGMWGSDVYDRLRRLEERVEEDMRQEERLAGYKRAQKIRSRREDQFQTDGAGVDMFM